MASRAAVLQRRSDLFRDDCWNTLTLKPRYRDALLAGTDTYAAIVTRLYSPQDRATDLAWIRSNQSAEFDFCAVHPGVYGCARICRAPCDVCADTDSAAAPPEALAIQPSGYPLCGAVGYRIGTSNPFAELYDPAGVVQAWKVFFEFADGGLPSPATMDTWSSLLAARGFRGDWKMNATSDTPDMAHFQYNNLIIHAWSPADALVAEEVGLAHFHGTLAGHGRGLDVGTPPNASNVTDWHHFLCEGDPNRLSDEALTFVGFGRRPDPALLLPATSAPSATAPSATAATLLPLSAYQEDRIAGIRIAWHPDFATDTELRAQITRVLSPALARIAGPDPSAFADNRLVLDRRTPVIPALPNKGRGIAVHRSAGWLTSHGFDAARVGVVEVYDGTALLATLERDPNALARSLTHALAVTHPERCPDVAARLGTNCPAE